MIFNGHLWTAKWWSFGDTPGGNAVLPASRPRSLAYCVLTAGVAGDWTDSGACTSFAAAVPSAHVAAAPATVASVPTAA